MGYESDIGRITWANMGYGVYYVTDTLSTGHGSFLQRARPISLRPDRREEEGSVPDDRLPKDGLLENKRSDGDHCEAPVDDLGAAHLLGVHLEGI